MMDIISIFAVYAGLSIIFTIPAVRVMRAVARAWKLERPNFKGKVIPTGFGFLLVLAGVPICAGIALAEGGTSLTGLSLLCAVLGFGVLGLLDDIYGTREVGGFRGHLGLLRQGKISTGLIKAVGGGALGLGLGAMAAGFKPVASVTNGLVISLAANTLNLLDLRPGRAVSCYWAGVLALALIPEWRWALWLILIPILAPVVWLTVMDRSAKVMLGDAGSNVLGALLGLAAAYLVGLPGKAVLILFMVAVHLYAEKYSISELIEGNRLLRSVDRLLGER